MTHITENDDIYYGVIRGVAQYILRGRSRKNGRAHTQAEVAARARRDLGDMAQYGYVSNEGDETRVVAEAEHLADQQQDTNVDWQLWAFGH